VVTLLEDKQSLGRDVVHSYTLCSPNVQVASAETPRKSRPYGFSRNPRRAVRFCRREKMTEICLCNGFFKIYTLIPCLFFNKLGLSMKFIPF
jgi:hypothetical protein